MKLAAPTPPRPAQGVVSITPTQDQAARLREMMSAYQQGVAASAQTPPVSSNPYYTPPAPSLAAIDTAASHVRHAAGAVPTHHAPMQVRPCAVPIVAITSGKGGVGKTSVAVNLAAALAMKSLRVTLVDTDLGLANADVLCGLSPVSRLDCLLDRGPGKRSIRQISVDAPGGFKLVPGAVGLSRMANLPDADRHELLDALADIERDNDLVILDTGAGVGDSVMGFVRHADLAVVVVTPEPTSIADAYALIKVFRLGQHATSLSHITLLVNQAADEREARAVHARIASTAKRFLGLDLPLLSWLRKDAALPASVRARGPVVVLDPKARVSADFHGLARGVIIAANVRHAPHAAVAAPRAGFFARILGRP